MTSIKDNINAFHASMDYIANPPLKCQAITQPGSPYELRAAKGGPCERTATHTDGERHFCTQHSKEFATVLRKATNKIRDGLRPIST